MLPLEISSFSSMCNLFHSFFLRLLRTEVRFFDFRSTVLWGVSCYPNPGLDPMPTFCVYDHSIGIHLDVVGPVLFSCSIPYVQVVVCFGVIVRSGALSLEILSSRP